MDALPGNVDARGLPTLPALSEFVADLAADQLEALQQALDHALHTLIPLTRLVQARRQQATPGGPPAPAGGARGDARGRCGGAPKLAKALYL